MNIKIVLTALLIGITQHVFAYPITPRPLRALIMESEYIVYAEVIDVIRLENEDRRQAKAVLKITEVLQGQIEASTIDVYFNPNLICPSPAKYIKGTQVLAFLDKLETGYFTHALSYGSKLMDTASYEVYKKRIVEMRTLLQLNDSDEKTAETVDWLVACALNPHTRWEGVYELSSESSFRSFYVGNKSKRSHHEMLLNAEQRSKLRTAFFDITEFGYYDIGLVDWIVQPDDTELIAFLTTVLKEGGDNTKWFQDQLMVKITEITGRNDLGAIIQDIESLNYSSENYDAQLEQLTQKFIDRL